MVVVTASAASAIGAGFLKSVLAAYYFGTSGAMDAYLVALLVPDMAMQLARTGAFNFIPLFAAEQQRSEEEAWRVASKLLSYWLLVLLGTLCLAYLLSPGVMSILAPGFTPPRHAQALQLTHLLLLMAASLGTGRILCVVLHAERRFVMAGLSEVVFQIGSTTFLVVFHGLGIEALAWAQVLGGFLQFLVAALALLQRRHRLPASLDLGSPAVRKLIRLNLPVYLGDSGDKINLMVTRSVGSFLPGGAVSALQYAYTPVEAAQRVLVGPLTIALFPFLSRRFAESDLRSARASLDRALVVAAVAFLPLAAAIWLLADPLVVVLFERGSFDVSSTALTASALRIFAPSVFALALNELIGSSYHARQDTMTPMRAGLGRLACNSLLCVVLTPALGHRGIALATTLSFYFKLLLLAAPLRAVFTGAELGRHLRTLGRVGLAVAAMVLLVYPLSTLGSAPLVLQGYAGPVLVTLGFLCLSVYSVALWLFARRQFLVLVALVRRVTQAPLFTSPPAPAAPAAPAKALSPEAPL
jgi:putative peptidoglycan lipid II flippase